MTKSLSLLSARSLSLAIAMFLSHVLLFCDSSSPCQNASCGTLDNISYPFGLSSSHLQGPDSHCGHPDFQIHCESDTPHLKINSVDYTILNFNRTQLRIANDAVLKNPTCGLPDASVNLSFSPFKFTSSYRNLLLGLGCNTYPIPSFLLCNNTPWAWTFTPLPFPAINCNPISVPIEASIEPIASLIEKALQKGFHVEWSEQDEAFKECRNCTAKNGICGFNASMPFICFVPDKPNSSSNGSSTDTPKPIPPSPPYTPQDRSKPDTRRSSPPNRDKSSTGVVIGVCVGSALLVATACVLAFLRHRRAREPKRLESGFDSGDDKHTELSGLPSKRGNSLMFFTYQELEQATDFFDVKRELGDGGFASVYLGKLWNGRLVAVKKLFHDNCKRVEQFGNEVRILSSLNHPNLVLLIGYCQYRRELLLVYEYASNGTLADHLHGERNGIAYGLSWETRLSIALETAQALAYLHFCVQPPIVHRDVKSSNILLDENFRAKVADFGLSRLVPVEATHVSTGPQGTPGYLDPDYHHCYRLTDKSDVYSFGVVLAELISAKKAVDISRDKKEVGLADLAVSKIQCGALHELVDPNLEIESNPLVKEMVSRVAELVFRCLASEKDDRPNMTEVAAQLQQIKEFGHGAGASQGTVPPTCFNSFDSNQETKKLLGHTYTSSRGSLQETWFSTSTSPDSGTL